MRFCSAGASDSILRSCAQILQGLEWAGVVVDAARNQEARGEDMRIASPQSQVDVRVIPVEESLMLAAEARAVLQRA